MATTNLGRVAIVPKGVYEVDTTYEKLDLVTGLGGSYMYINPTPAAGVSLTDTTHWQQIAEKGLKGDAFVYEDFTPGQLDLLVGDPTDSMTEANQEWSVI